MGEHQQATGTTKGLWGGAVTVDLPNDGKYFDVSRFRQVPDNQEVFVEAHEDGSATPDRSIIFEVVEFQQVGESADTIGEYFWTDLVRENEATYHEIKDINELSLTLINSSNNASHYRCICVSGIQWVPSRARSAECVSPLAVHVGILRIPEVHADILVSFLIPGPDVPRGLAAESGWKVQLDTHAPWYPSDLERLKGILTSFRIKSWELFST